MKAIFTGKRGNPANYAYEKKGTIDTLTAQVVRKGEIQDIVTAKFYMGRSASSSVVYCNVWVQGQVSGSGSAGGYGYHKKSAALNDALRAAGIEFYGNPYANDEGRKNPKNRAHFGGCGDGSMRAALEAIVKSLGYRGKVRVS